MFTAALLTLGLRPVVLWVVGAWLDRAIDTTGGPAEVVLSQATGEYCEQLTAHGSRAGSPH